MVLLTPLNEQFHSLVFLLEPFLSTEVQVVSVAQSAFCQFWQVILDRNDLASVVYALVSSKLDYYNAFYVGLPFKTIQKLQLVQNAVARVITGTRSSEHVRPSLAHLHWLPILLPSLIQGAGFNL